MTSLSSSDLSVGLGHGTLAVHINADIRLGFTTLTSSYATAHNMPHSYNCEMLIEGTKFPSICHMVYTNLTQNQHEKCDVYTQGC